MEKLPKPIEAGVERIIVESLGTSIRVLGHKPVSGGCINNGGEVKTSEGSFFVKWNDASVFPGMFEDEVAGLNLLGSTQTLYVPKVIGFGKESALSFIVLEWVKPRHRSSTYWTDLGHGLAILHSNTSTNYGLDRDNYIGSLRQSNRLEDDWVDFFIHQRLEPQVALARSNDRLSTDDVKSFERLYAQLRSLLPVYEASLIHGDLWSGNVIVDSEGSPCIIDPATYYANPEIEIAFTMLFGGFDQSFLRCLF